MSDTLDEKQRVSTTQPMPDNKGRPVIPWLIDKLQERREHGIRKYGAELHTQNGRKSVYDAFEEIEDMAIYMAQLIMELEELKDLKTVFWLISLVDKERDYKFRDIFIHRAMSIAKEQGLNCGFKIDPKEPKWPVAFIEVPGYGQFSWHTQEFQGEWDGHTTEDKYDRLNKFVNS